MLADESGGEAGDSPNKGIIPPNPYGITYEEMKRRFEDDERGPGVAKIMNPFMYVSVTQFKGQGKKIQFLTPKDLSGLFKNWRYVKVIDEKEKVVSFVDEWFLDPNMKTYRGVGSFPPKDKDRSIQHYSDTQRK